MVFPGSHTLTKVPDSNSPPPSERRAKARKRVLLGAVVAFGEGNISFRCSIRDITLESACIVIADGQLLPPEIYLITLRDHTAHRAEVKWVRGAAAGLHFLTSIDLSTSTDPSVEFLKRIWSNNSTPISGMPGS